MKTIVSEVERCTIEEFADRHGLVMEVSERDNETLKWISRMWAILPESARWYASFKDCDIKEDHILHVGFGDGPTQEVAIRNYARNISGKLLVVNAESKMNRKEIKVPELIDGDDK